MRNYLSILILNFGLITSVLNGQNILDGNFMYKTCELAEDSIGQSMIKIPNEDCYLSNWNSLGGTRLELISETDQLLFALNFGKKELVYGKYLFYRDYLQGRFESPLEKDIWYKFTAEMKTNVDATIGISDFEIFFGHVNLNAQLAPYQNRGVQPQIKQRDIVIPYNQFDYKTEWKKIERYYKGKGGETYLIIGNFNNTHTGFSNISGEVLSELTGNLHNASYLLKEIKLTKIEPPRDYVNEIPDELNKGDNITLSNIEFETNQSKIMESSYEAVEEIGKLLSSSGAKVHIIGHTDSIGDSISNMKLSKERADSLKDLLITTGVDPQKISTAGQGEESPIAENNTKEGRARNRRVEIQVLEMD